MALNDQVLLRLGGAIREYRLKADFSQQALADKAGVSRSSVRRLEAGEGGDISTLLNVLRGLGRLEDMNGILPKIPPKPTEVMKLRRREAARSKKRASRRSSPSASEGRATLDRGHTFSDLEKPVEHTFTENDDPEVFISQSKAQRRQAINKKKDKS